MKSVFKVKAIQKIAGIIAVVIAAIALNTLLITGCNNDPPPDDPPYVPPEKKSDKDRWWSWIEDTSTAALDYSVGNDGVCTITVSGKVDKDIWKAIMHYGYTEKEGASYVYTFEAWTASGTRNLDFNYFENNADQVWLSEKIPITNARATYRVYGQVLPSLAKDTAGDPPALRFSCADQLGTFYVKILEIKEYTPSKLTITNFSGNPDLSQNNYIRGYAWNSDGTILGFGVKMLTWYDSASSTGDYYSEGIQIKGNTITIPVWEVVDSEQYLPPYTFVPFFGDITIEAGYLMTEPYQVLDSGWDYLDSYYNTVPITFTNGSATIDFGTQMEKADGHYTPPGGNNAAAAPMITKQPQDRLYFIGETIEPLEVTGESPDGGIISYQWYSNTTASNSNGTAIPGATSTAYMPEISNSIVNNYYYYAVVTNTNDKVQETKTASIATRPVQISVASPQPTPAVNVYMTIPDPNQSANRFQYIRGYGGMDVAWGNFPRTTREDTELMYNPNRLGYNILRIMIKPDYIDPAQTIEELLKGDRPDYYENVKIVNKYGGYVLATPWTPPKEWKSNNSIDGVTNDGDEGYLLPQYYSHFAQYLRDFAKNMYNNGAPIYAISIANEPNYAAPYDGCLWEPEEMRDFWMEVGHFTDGVRGYGGGKEIPTVLTMNGESANTPYINRAVLRNPQTKAVVDLLARHIYGLRTNSLWNDYPDELQKGAPTDLNKGRMEVWMTDHVIFGDDATAYYNDSTWNYVWRFLNDVDQVIRQNNENAFVWWASKRFYSMVGDGQAGTTDGAPLPRGWALSHYARFTIGMTRIQVNTDTVRSVMKDGTSITHVGQSNSVLNNIRDDMDNIAVRVTAFISADGREISLVLWTPTMPNGTGGYDPGVIEVALPPGFTANGVTAVRSNGQRADQLFQPYNVQISQDRTKAYITLGKGEIVSVKLSK
jgi:O-glycosyl hydrolase